ncbi:glycerophosphodiester phosphodiesterase family protein [Prolixibacteraceae bacterium Z1-6]|uniref:Glycerophosphodiester phosphodiesterase family protein n=1 Tax=Draconibacterium aestuarii TaxID=2998507 RepID=A0A9X3F9V1_9BACT|nr:glycerophosphodiester phosphodiesterase family protein [Prolixibacteraceae bacterium Z1-6]
MKLVYINLIVTVLLLHCQEALFAQKVVAEFKSTKVVDSASGVNNNEGNLPKANNGGIYVVAHRGAHIGIPENSLPAFRKAIDLGCDFVEIDARKTKDGKIVSVHNSAIDVYVTGKTGKVSDYTLAELKEMCIGEKLGTEWKGTRIPTFEEILDLCKGEIGIYLDLKEPLVPELLEIIRKYEMESDIIWYIPASHMDVIKQLKKMCPECFPMPDPGPEKNIQNVVEQIHPRVMASDMGQLKESFVKTAHSYNVKVIVDEKQGTPAEWEKIIKWGTDGIQTDDPEALINYLKTK